MRGRTLLFVKVKFVAPCKQDRDRTESFRIMQFGTLEYLDERRNPIVCKARGQRSRNHLAEKPCRQNRNQTYNSQDDTTLYF
jgi:hypothetical protein